MIEALKSDDLVYKMGGRFKLATVIMKRWRELLEGARPLVDRQEGMTDIELVIQEILDGKIDIDYEKSNVPRPEEIIRIPERKAPSTSEV